MRATLKVAVLGAGVVGTEVIRILRQSRSDLNARTGVELELSAVAVRSDRERDPIVPAELITTDVYAAIDSADVVVEVMGGIEPTKDYLTYALSAGKSVVSANKALLAESGPQLFALAAANGANIAYEAAAAGAVPVVRGLREALAGDQVDRVLGIVNGTTNYILDQMTTAQLSFEKALAAAQELGYAEADPTADVEGHDAAAKAVLLASLAFHTPVSLDQVQVEGISKITKADIAAAARTGYVVKLLAIAERVHPQQGEAEGIAVRVHPALVPADHPLASVHGAFNAVFVQARAAGTLMFYGQGAGGQPTASAVMGDVVSVARNLSSGGKEVPTAPYLDLPMVGADRIQARYQIRVKVEDVPGKLAELAGVVADHKVSLETVQQVASEAPDVQLAHLILVTHRASEQDLADCVAALANHAKITSVLRVEGN